MGRNDALLDKSYALDSAADSTKPLFEGAVAVVSTTGAIPSLAAGEAQMFGICRPDDAIADDGGFTYAGIIDNGGFTGSPLFNLSAGSTNFPLPQDRYAKLQLLGFAKCKGLPSTQFLYGEDVGFLPNYRQNAGAVELGGGWVVPLRLYPGARLLGTCRSALTTSALVTSGGVIQHQQSSDFITVELAQTGFGKGERLIGGFLADSAAQTGSAEVAFGTDGGAIPSADVAQVRVYANMLKAGSLLIAEAQIRLTGLNGADTMQAQLRYGGATGALLATSGQTKVFAAGDRVTLRSVLAVAGNVTGRVVNSLGALTTIATGIVSQSSGGLATGDITLPAITSDRMVVGTIKFSSANAGNTAVIESMSVRYIR